MKKGGVPDPARTLFGASSLREKARDLDLGLRALVLVEAHVLEGQGGGHLPQGASRLLLFPEGRAQGGDMLPVSCRLGHGDERLVGRDLEVLEGMIGEVVLQD